MEKIGELYNRIIKMLPREPRSYDINDDPGFWTNGTEILCPSGYEQELVAEFLNDIFSEFGNYSITTGYYDPCEDAENGEQDKCTGFWYIDVE